MRLSIAAATMILQAAAVRVNKTTSAILPTASLTRPEPLDLIISKKPSMLTRNRKSQKLHVDRPALTVQSPHNIRRADRLALTHLDNSTDVSQQLLEEVAQVQARLLVDTARDALDAAAASEAADVRLGDALDVVA